MQAEALVALASVLVMTGIPGRADGPVISASVVVCSSVVLGTKHAVIPVIFGSIMFRCGRYALRQDYSKSLRVHGCANEVRLMTWTATKAP